MKLCAFLLIPVMIFAHPEAEHIAVGSRSMSSDAIAQLQTEKERTPLPEETKEAHFSKRQQFWGGLPPVYYPNSIHWLAAVSVLGDQVEFQDGSVWKVSSYDGYKVLNWRSEDPILLTQNNRWFTSFEYRLINKNTGSSVQANLFLGPIQGGEHTFYIASMDLSRNEIALSDHTYWQICRRDSSIFRDWAPNDAIIIGYNSGWESNYETLLINVNMNNFVRAKQF